MTIFQAQPTSANASGVSTQMIWDLMAQDFGKPWTVKELLAAVGLDLSEYNIKNVSNRCSYLAQTGHAKRIAQGTYALIEKGTDMTMTEPAQAESNGAAHDVPVQAPSEFQCPTCGFSARSQMGLRTHITKNHKPKLNTDEAFERVAQATKILFPDPESIYDRFEEIGELRKQMLRAVTR